MNNSLNKLRNWKTFAIVLGAIAITSVITVSSAMAQTTTTPNTTTPQIQGSVNLQNLMQSSVKEKFSDAENAAVSKIPNGKVINGKLGVVQGSLVYQFTIVDDKNLVYQVIVDAGNGSVLYTSQGQQMGTEGMLGMGGTCKHGKHGFNNYESDSETPSQTPSTNAPSATQ
ncbi:MAG: hypothetical protein E6L00_06305 [Thaumarchaeota archaeon]|nr:MAG: hypothetical protein E6L02_03825 [Nitrososphaerota archaeon]TLX81520.1 MAG: hypothetical protein E6L00_06305 [Nitrososphaerota archaeon]